MYRSLKQAISAVFFGVFLMGFLTPAAAVGPAQTVYDFAFESLLGDEPLRLSDYKGKVLLIVNTASHCGFTSQYAGLEKLYTTYKDKGLVVIGVPSNDFGGQEPGSSEEISHFCRLNYGVSFPLSSKESVSGKKAHPFYQYAKKTLGFGTAPKWNFHKYLVNRKGVLIDYFNSTTSPDSARLIKAVEAALAQPQ
ncbi:MAG: glutathione peroxidase [Gammaproteobacteria bacterium]|nr:glutathione peroxidase [Gammaproteobacteria bacterium]